MKDTIDDKDHGRKFRYKDALLSNSNDKSHSDILNNKIETVPDLLKDLNFISKNFKGKVNVIPSKDISNFDPIEKKDKIEDVCLAEAIKIKNEKGEQKVTVDNAKCFLCGRCEDVYPSIFKLEGEFKFANKKKEQLIESFALLFDDSQKKSEIGESASNDILYERIGIDLKKKIKSIFGRSLAIREVDAGSCNGCEIEITALNNPIYDIERFGIHFVSSPRHADALLITGTASQNMKIALEKTFQSTPTPKIVLAVGACACSGGIFGDTYATTGGIDTVLPVDVYIPGCPPRPEALIYGLLMAIDKIKP